MAVPQDKEALLGLIDASFEKLAAALASTPEALARERSLPGHAKDTQMSPCDLVAYLVGWNELLLKWLERDAAGHPIDIPGNRLQMERARQARAEILPRP
ncbi:ClbS/DfsB family four-helix bundle protein [Bosea sp. (in: a-proteobacteria)]|uniref:ClbS/DfsB family four-helix bundle protein n=1 Tax=Bosea sp. (in: a-proteobacteria) TaxID=1871050 RepID=UPI0025B82DBB|nr:ClbS/DfsB family four-helix bundle protein [Bosea sp. (in: a-proteobacteria)]